jgi:hypothetical protein
VTEKAELLQELRRMRWLLWGLTVALVALGWAAGPLVLGLGMVFVILAVRNELLIRRGRRYLDTVA